MEKRVAMTFEEAEEKALNLKWKVGTCDQGEKCWCRTVVPVEPVFVTEKSYYSGLENENEYEIVGPGVAYAKVAERIVNDHNRLIDFWND